MNLQVEISSTQMIKPSIPTPNHLKHFKFSSVDQLSPWIYTPTIFFYKSSPCTTKNITTRLEDSLSQTLSIYYPVAGRIAADESTIECTDEGVLFFKAQAKCTLSDFLRAPNKIELLHHFLPISDSIRLGANHIDTFDDKKRNEIVKNLVMFAAQVTTFECGGLAIGCFGLHKLLDGMTAGGFFRCWGSLTGAKDGGETVLMRPDFVAAIKMFPPITSEEMPKRKLPLTMWPIEEGECIIKPFLFNGKAIAALRDKSKSEDVPNPSRIEAVSAFIWKHAMAAATPYSRSRSQGQSSALVHVVNIRPHTRPPLPPTSVGNIIMYANSYYDQKDGEDEPKLPRLVVNIRRSISKMKDPELLGKFLGDEGRDAVINSRKQEMGLANNSELNVYKFSSWSKFYVDFGFGEPIWTALIGGKISSYFRNLVLLVDTPDNGIEAWVILDEHGMNILDSDLEFLAFASTTT